MSDWWQKAYPGGPPVGPPELPRPLYAPGNPSGKPPSTPGPDVVAFKRAVSRLGRWPWDQRLDDTYTPGFARGTGGNVRQTGVAGFQRQQKIEATGNVGNETYQNLRYARIPEGLENAGQPALDPYSVQLLEWAVPEPTIPNLGPVYAGGASVLAHDLTHATSGIPLYPAFDDCFQEGKPVIAPEAIVISRDSSANPGDACYADGVDSLLRWWFGHLAQAPAVGTVIDRGGVIGYVAANTIGGGPHVHVALNVEHLWGTGVELTHHTDYTHGAPTVGAQLEAGYPL